MRVNSLALRLVISSAASTLMILSVTAAILISLCRDFVEENFDLRPAAFRRYLDLHRPIFQKTAAYGHFGREDSDFTWERTDRADTLREAAGLGFKAEAPA